MNFRCDQVLTSAVGHRSPSSCPTSSCRSRRKESPSCDQQFFAWTSEKDTESTDYWPCSPRASCHSKPIRFKRWKKMAMRRTHESVDPTTRLKDSELKAKHGHEDNFSSERFFTGLGFRRRWALFPVALRGLSAILMRHTDECSNICQWARGTNQYAEAFNENVPV